MKKRNLFYALTAGIALFSACNNNSDEFTPTDDNAAQQLVLQVASSGDGLTTRAGRPLYSSEAKQTIENVKVIICNGTNVVYDTLINDWMKSSETYELNGHGRETTISLKHKKLDAATYTVYAIGYSTNTKYQANGKELAAHLKEITANKTFDANLKLTLEQTTEADKIGEEIFATSVNLTIEEGKGFNKAVVLHRQVAGTFGYFKEVPYIAGAAKLRLVAYNRNQDLVLGQFNPNIMAENGTEKNTAMFVVNGTSPANDKVIYEINLADWYTNGAASIVDADSDGLIDITNWKKPDALAEDANFENGSFFGGSFVIPFAKDATVDSPKNTFELQLTDNGGKVLRTWIVKLPSTDKQLKEHDLYTWGTNFTSEKNTDSQNVYNVVRNHLYGIGTRTLDKPTDPQPGPGPEPDPDKPESLNNKQVLILQVNDNWELIHSMELD